MKKKESYEEYRARRTIIEENNRKLNNAAVEGDLEKVIELTTSPAYEGLVEPDCDFNYPLRGACIKGNIAVIDFLINFPIEEIRKKITSTDNILSAVRASAEYAQPSSLLYFKKHFSTEYSNFINSGRHDGIFDLLTMRGNLDTIKLLMVELPENSKFDYPLFISKSIQYDKMNCFDYFLPLISKEELSKSKKQEDIIHTCLYHERFEYLEKLMETGAIDLNKNISLQNFRILVESKFDSLVHVVQNYDYHPNEKLMEKIIECINDKKDYSLKNCVIKFINVLEKHKLKTQLEETVVKKEEAIKPFRRKV